MTVSDEPLAPGGSRGSASPAMRLRAIPITMFATDGTLSLTDGRLVFAKSRRRVVLDIPLHQMHSVMSSPMGFHIWHGQRRLKFATGEMPTTSAGGISGVGAMGLGVATAQTRAALAEYRASKDLRDNWVSVLTPLVGARPTGLRVRKPWPLWALLLTTVAVALAIIGGIVWYSLATP